MHKHLQLFLLRRRLAAARRALAAAQATKYDAAAAEEHAITRIGALQSKLFAAKTGLSLVKFLPRRAA